MKAWAPQIRKHIATWSERLVNRAWWPNYLYHFTDIHNAVSILTEGRLYSRASAQQLGLMRTDNASPDIIINTRVQHTHYARLYFRPRTPTQFCNEGIRPEGQRDRDSHCPIPVFFCFDAYRVLSADETLFSDGNMGSPRAHFDNTLEFFSRIPFGSVYHDGRFEQEDRDEIIFRRNAEILIPDYLLIEPHLRRILVRSVAERESLAYLLPRETFQKWQSLIDIDVNGYFFERKWTFVEEAVVVGDSVRFRFNPNSKTPGPFRVRFAYNEDVSNDLYSYDGNRQSLAQVLPLRLTGADSGVACLRLDDAVAFHARLTFTEIPF